MITRRHVMSGMGATMLLGLGRVARSDPRRSAGQVNASRSLPVSGVDPQTNLCPTLGFVDFTDVSWLGQPKIGQPVQVEALLHNLSPSGYLSLPGEVEFRWRPFGWTGDYCTLPFLQAVQPTTNPAEAMDVDKNVLISPGSSLPAKFIWIPGPADVGSNLKGFIECRAIALGSPVCPVFVPPDCSTAPYNVQSGRVTVLPK
jgi:hypothetical protein